LKVAITELHQGFRRTYGAPRVHQSLRQEGHICSVRRVNRLMRELGMKASTTGLYSWRPGQHEFYSSTGNQLKQEHPPNASGQQWVGDFTYLRTATGWLYLAVVMDVYQRKIVGWSFSSQRNSELTISALRMAIREHPPQVDCLFHSDQGIEYAAHSYRDVLEQYDMRRSMSRRATPLDNAVMESFFHTLKAELVQRRVFASKIEAVADIVHYINFYNRDRLHSSLNYQSPENYEKLRA
jgi:putative transposase